MIGLRKDTIPVDSLLISRKVMTESRATLEGEVRVAVRDTGLNTSPFSIREEQHIVAKLISQKEYAEQKLSNRRLGIFSVISLVERFNAAKLNNESMNVFATDVEVGEVAYNKISEGKFVVGFMLSEKFRQRISHERTEAIDIVLDSADFPLTDPFRQWRNEEDDSMWLPVLRVSTVDPSANEILEDFSGSLNIRTAGLSIDLYDAQARVAVADLPVQLFKF